MTSFIRAIRCSRCDWSVPAGTLARTCPECAAPLLAAYDLPLARTLRAAIASRPASLWRYREVLPLPDGSEPVTLGEGVTPLLHARRTGSAIGLENLYVKDESLNPTRSFKSRGMAVAVTMARELGCSSLAAPTAGNAGCALAAYGARAGIPVFVAMPDDTPASIVRECRDYGAEVVLVRGVITVAAKRVQEHVAATGAFDMATLREPYRIEGKKTMGYELLEDLGRMPDVILYPTGGGTGLIGMWKAFAEMERLGWIGEERPRMFAVQSSGCAPMVRAFHAGLETAPEWEAPETSAWGLRVPRAIGDRLILAALRESSGGAIAIDEELIEPAAERLRRLEGIDAGPEGGATIAAAEQLLAQGLVDPADTVVAFNTGGNKYV